MAKEENDEEQKSVINAEYRELYSDRIGAIKSAQNALDPLIKVGGDIPYHQIEYLHDVNLNLIVEFGRSRMLLGEVLKLHTKSVISVEKSLGEPVDIIAGESLIARGEIVIVNERLGIRITEIVRPIEKTQITTGDQTAAAEKELPGKTQDTLPLNDNNSKKPELEN